MHGFDLIFTLTGALAVALVFGYLTQRVGLSPIVGYLLAGIAVGPHTPGFEADRALAEQMAEIGVVLLMFGVGLQFHLEELLAVRRVAIPGAITQSVVATLLGVLVGRAFGWDWSAGILFGAAISVASTVVLVRVLADNRDLHTPTGHIAVGWLVVEDLFTVLLLVVLPALFGGEAQPAAGVALAGLSATDSIGMALLLATINVVILVAFTFVVGGRVIPWLLARVAGTRSRELFTLTVLVVALGIAVGAARVFGVSMALGAFLAGMVVGRSEFSYRAASEALPMRDAFAVLFFVSVGMLLEPDYLLAAPGLIAATLAIILVGKPLAALSIVVLLGYPRKVGLSVAVALAQIGEFSFILAALGEQLEILTADVTNTLIAAAILSISINPLLYRLLGPLDRWLEKQARARRWLARRKQPPAETEPSAGENDDQPTPTSHRAVVIGYGPVGRTVTRLLRENGVEPTVVELNFEVVQRLKRQGVAAVYGDASQRETLLGAGVDKAGSLILSASNVSGSHEVIRLARELNPLLRVMSRSDYVAEIAALRKAGADNVFSGEGEVALAFTVAVLGELGATAEQIDRERERVHEELIGEAQKLAPQRPPTATVPPVESETPVEPDTPDKPETPTTPVSDGQAAAGDTPVARPGDAAADKPSERARDDN